MRTWSPGAMCLSRCGWAFESPTSAPVRWATTVWLKLSWNSRRRRGDAALGLFRQLLLGGAVFDGADGFAHLELEVLYERGEFGFEFAGAVADFEIALAGETSALLVQGVLLLARGFFLDLKLRQLVVEFVEEAGDIDLLGTKAPARCGDDGGVESEALCGSNAGGCAGHAEAQLVVGGERCFVEACGGVEDAFRVGGVDLERGVVGGDKRPGARLEEVICDSDGERCALRSARRGRLWPKVVQPRQGRDLPHGGFAEQRIGGHPGDIVRVFRVAEQRAGGKRNEHAFVVRLVVVGDLRSWSAARRSH